MQPLPDVLDLSPDELAAFFRKEMGEESYRARQLATWIYERGETDFDRMTDLPRPLRKALGRRLRIGVGSVEEVARSRRGAAAKYLFSMDDRAKVEAVSMREGRRHTICLSTQVGCAMGCAFCATASLGFRRNLSCGEMILQALEISRAEGRITNAVFMGMGEPLLNLPNVLKAVQALTGRGARLPARPASSCNSPSDGVSPAQPAASGAAGGRLALGARRVTVSTCGIVPGIEELARSPVPVRLALSLNSPFQEQRAELMPIAQKYPLRGVLDACARYRAASGRRLTLEYVLLRSVNMTRRAAEELARIASGLDGMVNLIEYNPSDGLPFDPPIARETLRFRTWLEKRGVNVTIRYRRGREIAAGCGQLAADGKASEG